MSNPSGFNWYKSARDRDEYWFAKAKNRFAASIERLMEFRGVKQKDLAKSLNQSPANISKVLSGDANLTIETMVKLVRALDAEVSFEVSPIGAKTVPWLYCLNGGKPKASNDTEKQRDIETWKQAVEGDCCVSNG